MIAKKENLVLVLDKVKICKLCHKEINEKTEKWVMLINYFEKNVIEKIDFYHDICWKAMVIRGEGKCK